MQKSEDKVLIVQADLFIFLGLVLDSTMLKKALLLGILTAAASLAAPITYTANLSGANEPIPTGASSGFATVTIDTALHTLLINLSFTGLTGGVATAAHIHCCIAPNGTTGVAVPFAGFPAATSGTYNSGILNTTLTATFQSSFLTANGGTAASAEAALAAGLAAGQAYVNIHNATFPGGEERGFLTPEPGTFGLMSAAVLGLGLIRRKK